MADFLMFSFLILFICYWFFLYSNCDSLIKDIIQFKANNQKESSFASWTLGGFLLVFHFLELSRLKNKYLKPNDYDFIVRYKRLYFQYWLFLFCFVFLAVIEMTTSF